MAFETFLYKPSNEYELLTQLAREVQNSFHKYHGQSYYIHLTDVGNRMSMIDEVKQFTDAGEFWDYTYITRDRKAGIIFRSDPGSISMLLNGEYDFAIVKIAATEVQVTFGPEGSVLPGTRRSKMTALETMEAFGFIQNSLHELRGKKTA